MRRADLEAIVALPHLEELHLMPCRAYGPDAFQPLANAKGLRVLEIRDNGWVLRFASRVSRSVRGRMGSCLVLGRRPSRRRTFEVAGTTGR